MLDPEDLPTRKRVSISPPAACLLRAFRGNHAARCTLPAQIDHRSKIRRAESQPWRIEDPPWWGGQPTTDNRPLTTDH
jgi:hypothetical protein